MTFTNFALFDYLRCDIRADTGRLCARADVIRFYNGR